MKGKYVHRNRSGQEIGTTEYTPSAAEVGAQVGSGIAVAYGLWKGFSQWVDVRVAEHAVNALTEGRYDEAINRTTLLIRSYPKEADLYFLRGTAYGYANHINEAIVDFTSSIQLNSSHDRAFASRADCYANQEQWGNALSDISNAIHINPNLDIYWCWRGGALRKIGDLDQSLSNLSQAIVLNPGNIDNYMERAKTYLDLKELENAIVDISRAIKLSPNNPQCYHFRSEVYRLQGAIAESDMDLAKANELEQYAQQQLIRQRAHQIAEIARKQSQRNDAATISLIFGILTWWFLPGIGAIVAIVAGHKARHIIRLAKGNRGGSSQALIGLILGYTHIVVLVCVLLYLLATGIFSR